MSPFKLLLFLIAAGVTAFGDTIGTPAYEFESIPVAAEASLSLGFWFKTQQTLQVTALGYFDEGSDGFEVSHQVGLFDADGNRLTATTISAGDTDELQAQFRYRSIAPLQLLPDTWYVVAATTGGPSDRWGYGQTGDIDQLTISPLIWIPQNGGMYIYHDGDEVQFPTEYFGYRLYSGPNFLMTEIANVPEPGSIVLTFLGASALALAGYRQRKIT